jgi:dihydroorotate dehydrogenase
MYPFFRPLLFRLSPERAHGLTVSLLRFVGTFPALGALLRRSFVAPARPLRAFGLDFSNPVGLAAGYDKDGLAWRGLACLGFGHLELGTVTLRPQPGNPRPRLFRLPADQALVNRMGFPSRGADFLTGRLGARRPAGLVIGVNLGKNKETPLEEAWQDYHALVEIFAPLADYLAINVSSPNTAGLRQLQSRLALENLLSGLNQVRRAQESHLGRPVPLLVKLAPDLTSRELDEALEAILNTAMDGVIATNTTLSRKNLHSPLARETGGLSGAPLTELSTQMVRHIYQRSQGKLPVIAAGGIMNTRDAVAKLEAGATLIQVYTGLVYAGPGLVQQIVRSLKAA